MGGDAYTHLKRKVFCPTLPDFSKNNGLEKEKRNLYSLLSKLQKQNLIEKQRKGQKTYWITTQLGRKKLNRFKNVLRFPKLFYKKERDNGLNVVIFDIPEDQKTKRNWLREALLALNFSMLQKSVWVGKNKIPEDFLKDLAILGLNDFIHIFKIAKTGTIKKH